MPLPKSNQVTEKSTKSDLWQAYSDLRTQIEGEPIELPFEEKEKTTDALKNMAELKLQISQQLDQAGDELLKSLDEINGTKNWIANAKRKMLERLEEQRQALENEVNQAKKQAAEEKSQTDLIRQRQEEEYDYELDRKRRQQEDDYSDKKAAREKILQQKEEAFKVREDEINQMKKDLDNLPVKINSEVKSAQGNLAKELTDKHQIELREAKLDYEREKKIYEIRISSLDATIKSQNAEIQNLKSQLAKASEQIKDIAVSVVSAGNPSKKDLENESHKN